MIRNPNRILLQSTVPLSHVCTCTLMIVGKEELTEEDYDQLLLVISMFKKSHQRKGEKKLEQCPSHPSSHLEETGCPACTLGWPEETPAAPEKGEG